MNSRVSIQDVWFDDETMRAMSEAFDQACDALGNFGEGVTVREIIVKRIIEVAKNGERNPVRFYQQALKALGIDEMSANQLAA
jgi:hypothetical protein